jgi:hypothetical protein
MRETAGNSDQPSTLYSLGWWDYQQGDGRRFGVDVRENATMTVDEKAEDAHREAAASSSALVGGTWSNLSYDAELADASETNQVGSENVSSKSRSASLSEGVWNGEDTIFKFSVVGVSYCSFIHRGCLFNKFTKYIY